MRKWVCSVCGSVHFGSVPPDICPVCGVSSREFSEEVDKARQFLDAVRNSSWIPVRDFADSRFRPKSA